MEHRDEAGVRHRMLERDGVRLHVAQLGPEDGPLVVLLHGFPARWSTWRGVMPALARAGFLVAAPDMRGYGDSDKPVDRSAYSIVELVEDVVHVVKALGRERACIAGHDFGGGIAWATAMLRPEVVSRLAILNAVHPVGIERQMRKPSQLAKSWYVLFFLLPTVPEWFLARNGYAFLEKSLADDGLAKDVIADVLEGVRAPGALRSAIDAYRQSFLDAVRKRLVPVVVDHPVRVIWGDRERHLDPELADPPRDWVTNAQVTHLPEAGHWVQHDASERVGALLVEHFAKS